MEPDRSSPEARPFPPVDVLDGLSPEACAAELGPLFEGAPAFVRQVVAARPFGSDEGLVAAAYQLARELPEAEAIELVNAHPRIGSPPAAMSPMSRSEQGYAAETWDEDSEEGGGEPAWVDEELTGLNEVYERAFGFRYVMFVAGRPREAIIPLLEASLRNEREAELRRAVAECVAIAEDRLRALRGIPAQGEETDEADG